MDEAMLANLVSKLRLAQTDTQNIEVKAAGGGMPASLAETVSAFANGSGGLIILGLSEKNGFAPAKGFDAAHASASLAQLCSDSMTPPVRATIEILEFEGAPVVVAHIPEIIPLEKPCYITARGAYGGAFIRVGDGDRKLTPYELDRLFEERHQPKHDIEVINDATLKDLDSNLLQQMIFRQKSLHPRVFASFSDEEVLESMHVVARDENGDIRPTLAGLLTFGTFPQSFFPRLTITFAAFPGTTKAGEGSLRFLDSQNFIGPIPIILEDALAAVRKNTKTKGIIDGAFRRDAPDYPGVAVREALCNALMHRDYSPMARGSQVQVNLYSDRLEVLSPGGLYGNVTVETLGETGASSTRNQYLSALLETAPFGNGEFVAENRGTGMQLIENELERAGMQKPIIRDTLSSFRIIFQKNDDSLYPTTQPNAPKVRRPSQSTRGSSDSASHNIVEAFRMKAGDRDILVSYIADHSEARAAELSEALGIPRRTVTYHLAKLVNAGVLEKTKPSRSPNQSYRLASGE